MKGLVATLLAAALVLLGCQRQPAPPEGGGGGGTAIPSIYPSPLKAPPHPRLIHGTTGGVRHFGGPPMGGMDPSGIGPGNVEAGGGGGGGGGGLPLGDPKRYPPPQRYTEADPNAAPINAVASPGP